MPHTFVLRTGIVHTVLIGLDHMTFTRRLVRNDPHGFQRLAGVFRVLFKTDIATDDLVFPTQRIALGVNRYDLAVFANLKGHNLYSAIFRDFIRRVSKLVAPGVSGVKFSNLIRAVRQRLILGASNVMAALRMIVRIIPFPFCSDHSHTRTGRIEFSVHHHSFLGHVGDFKLNTGQVSAHRNAYAI